MIIDDEEFATNGINEDDDIEYRTLSRNGKCCVCGRKILANKNKVIHCYNYKSNAGTITLCNFCIDRIYLKAHGTTAINTNRMELTSN